MAILRVGKPRRHFARKDCVADSFRPGPRFRERAEGHGRDLAGTMALLAALLKNRQDLFVEGGRCGSCSRCRRNPENSANEPGTPRTCRDTLSSRNGAFLLRPFL